jgi:RNA polymerase sigma-70 factor (ECF subfamily)
MPHVLDRAEFGRMFAANARLLWVVAAAFVPKAAVEDVLQDAAAVALTRLAEFAPGTSFSAWMTQIVRFVAANSRRREQRLAAGALDGDLVPAAERAEIVAHEVVAHNGRLHDGQAEFDDHVVRALQDLPADARASLLLRVVMDSSYREIGATLGLPEGTVASHVHRARVALRERLAPAQPRRATVPMHRDGHDNELRGEPR